MVDKWKTFQKVFHMTKIRKSANNQVMHKFIHIIHIIHIKNGGLFYVKKRTNVLWSYDKNSILSKKIGKRIDF